MTFQVGDKVKWKLPRKGTVVEVTEHHFTIQLGDENWSFDTDEIGKFEIIKPKEPVIGSVAVDNHGDAVTRDEDGWRYSHSSVGTFPWRWKDLYNAYGPLTVVYNYVDTSSEA